MSPFSRSIARGALVLLSVIAACSEGPAPLGPRAGGGLARLSLSARYAGSVAASLPVERVRLTARDAATGAVLAPTPTTLEVDPEAKDWALAVEVRLEAGTAAVEVLVELLHVSSGAERVQWSGLSAPVPVGGGSEPPPVTVEVYPGPPANLEVTGLAIRAPAASLVEGATLGLTAEPTVRAGSSPAGVEVAWASLDPEVATVTPEGVVTGLRDGRARIVAAAGPARSEATLTVLQRIAEVALDPAGPVRVDRLGAEVLVTARVLDPRGAPVAGAAVAWSSGDPGVVESVGGGLFRAVGNGTAEARAVATAPGEQTAAAGASITVAQAPASVEVEPAAVHLRYLGEEAVFSARVLDAGGHPIPGAEVAWAVEGDGIEVASAAGLSVAVVSRAEGIARRTAVVRATAGSVTGEANVTARQLPARVAVGPEGIELDHVGARAVLTARVEDAGGSPMRDAPLAWRAIQSELVTVVPGEAGTAEVVSVARGVAPRPVRIEATSRVDEEGQGAAAAQVSGGAELTAYQRPATVEVTPDRATLDYVGHRAAFAATVKDRSGTLIPDATVQWASSDAAVFTVSPEEGASTEAISAALGLADRTAVLAATSGTVQGEANVTARQVPASTEVTPAQAELLAIGATIQLEASVKDGGGTAIAGAPVSWASSDPAVATVSDAGVVTAVSNGTAEVTANGDPKGVSAITVRQVAAGMFLHAGDGQSATVATTVPVPPAVRVTDVSGAPVEGVAVAFTVVGGGGVVRGSPATTDADGVAAVESWRLGTEAGPNTLVAELEGIPDVVFRATGTPGPPDPATSELTVDPAVLTANGTDAAAVGVLLRDRFGNALATGGSSVGVAATAGTLSPVTDHGDGTYGATLTAPTTVGTSTVSATVDGMPLATSVNVRFDPGPVDHFLVEAAAGGPIPDQEPGAAFPIRIVALDAFDNIATGFTGTVDVTSTGNLSQGGGTTPPFGAGLLSPHSVTISNQGSFTITATRTGGSESGTSNAFQVGKAEFILFSRKDPNSDWTTWRVNPDGTGEALVTEQETLGRTPKWSPDGRRLLFAASDIYTMKPDGSDVRRLTFDTNSFQPAWSPDGGKIVFVSKPPESSEREIFVMNADGSGRTRLTNAPRDDLEPDWSPDGTRIAFMSKRIANTNQEIFVMNADGSAQTNITNSSQHEDLPRWSPDGSKIAFRRLNATRDTYVVNPDGTGLTLVGDGAPTWQGGSEFNHAWSPDGSRIAFDADYNGARQIHSKNPDGTGLVTLTDMLCGASRPRWSPDGSRIVFQGWGDDCVARIYAVNPDGTGLKALTNPPPGYEDADPRWRP